MRRALGRRVDPEDDKIYHIEDMPPPTNVAPLCERLLPLEDDNNAEATLIDRWISFDQGAAELDQWLQDFGDARSGLSVLYKIAAAGNKDTDVSPQIREIFVSLIARKEERESEIRLRIDKQLDEVEAAEAEKARIAAEEEEERKRLETEGPEGEAAAAKKDEGPKVERPEPATERVPPKDPGIVNIDNDFKPTVLKVWEELSDTYKQQMKRVFRQVRV